MMPDGVDLLVSFVLTWLAHKHVNMCAGHNIFQHWPHLCILQTGSIAAGTYSLALARAPMPFSGLSLRLSSHKPCLQCLSHTSKKCPHDVLDTTGYILGQPGSSSCLHLTFDCSRVCCVNRLLLCDRFASFIDRVYQFKLSKRSSKSF